MEEIDTAYDVIVLGTGLVESLVAGACARIGAKVLHLDSNEYYGGQWASFSLIGLQEWFNKIKELKVELATGEGEDCLSNESNMENLLCPQSVFYNVKHNLIESSAPPQSESSQNSQNLDLQIENELKSEEAIGESECKSDNLQSCTSHSKLIDQSRKFNLDLAPKVVYSRGKLVELLISSNVARYLEFKCLNRILSFVSDGESDNLVEVPCSRSDVFKTDSVSLIEKRLLMKFMEFCHNYEEKESEWKDYASLPFSQFLSSRKLSKKVQHFIFTSIAMVGINSSTEEGLKRMSLFITSLGRFGSMPFLYPLYGSGEIPQAFCRLCAVFEGIYMLRTKIDSVVKSQDRIEGIVSEGKQFNCKHLVLSNGYIPEKYSSYSEDSLSRAIFITDKSINSARDDHVTLLHTINRETNETVKILELGTATGVCPKETCVIHMTCKGSDAENDFKPIVEKLFGVNGENKVALLDSFYFNQRTGATLNKDVSPPNLYCCNGPDETMDYDTVIEQANQIFNSMFPGSEFLPRAPDPDEIIFDGAENDDDDVNPDISSDNDVENNVDNIIENDDNTGKNDDDNIRENDDDNIGKNDYDNTEKDELKL